MRKLLWCGLVAMAAGVCGTGYYSYCHPHSVVGQFVLRAGAIGLCPNPFVLATRGAVHSTIEQEEKACSQAAEECTPDEPKLIEEPADAKALAGAVLDLNPVMRIPAPIIIREEDDALPGNGAEPMVNADNQVQPVAGRQVGGTTIEADVDNSCPRIMPYAADEAAGKHMPYAGETENHGAFDAETFNQAVEKKSAAGSSEENEPKEVPKEEPAAGGASTEPAKSDESGSTPEYYHHPYSER
jgi:hypothetical protein